MRRRHSVYSPYGSNRRYTRNNQNNNRGNFNNRYNNNPYANQNRYQRNNRHRYCQPQPPIVVVHHRYPAPPRPRYYPPRAYNDLYKSSQPTFFGAKRTLPASVNQVKRSRFIQSPINHHPPELSADELKITADGNFTEVQFNQLIENLRNRNLQQLREISIVNSSLSDTQLQTLVRAIQANVNIQKVSLEGNKALTLDGLHDLLAHLKQCEKLEVLNLKKIHFGDSGAKKIAKLIPSLNLQELDLEDTHLSSEGVRYLTKGLERTDAPPLKKLNLSENEVKDRGIKFLCRLLRQVNISIEEITLRNTHISNTADLEGYLTHNTALKTLNLQYNQLGGNKVISLLEAIVKNSKRQKHQELTVLVPYNALHTQDIEKIHLLMRQYPWLKVLYNEARAGKYAVSKNEITQQQQTDYNNLLKERQIAIDSALEEFRGKQQQQLSANNRRYVFYDFETTGLDPFHDQIIQAAIVVTDSQLNPIHKEKKYVKQGADFVPSIKSVQIHQIPIQKLEEEGISEYELALWLYNFLTRPNTVSIGYNSLSMDNQFLRALFYRNLLPSCDHEHDNQLRGTHQIADLYPFIILHALENSPVLDLSLPNLKLDTIAKNNGLTSGASHDAAVDTRHLLNVTKRLSAEPYRWEQFLSLFNPKRNSDLYKKLDSAPRFSRERCALLIRHKKIQVVYLVLHNTLKEYQGKLPPRGGAWFILSDERYAEQYESLPDEDKIKYIIHTKEVDSKLLLPLNDRLFSVLMTENPDLEKIICENLAWLSLNTREQHLIDMIRRNFFDPVPQIDINAHLYFPPYNHVLDTTNDPVKADGLKALRTLLTQKDLNFREIESTILHCFHRSPEARQLAVNILYRMDPQKAARELSSALEKEKKYFEERIEKWKNGTPFQSYKNKKELNKTPKDILKELEVELENPIKNENFALLFELYQNTLKRFYDTSLDIPALLRERKTVEDELQVYKARCKRLENEFNNIKNEDEFQKIDEVSDLLSFVEEDDHNHWYEEKEISILLSYLLGEGCIVGTPVLAEANPIQGFRGYLENPQGGAALLMQAREERRIFLLPINLRQNHWTILIMDFSDNPENPRLIYADPLGGEIPKKIHRFLQYRFPNQYVLPLRSHLQQDGHNCGPWIVEIARFYEEHRALPNDDAIDIVQARIEHNDLLEAFYDNPPMLDPDEPGINSKEWAERQSRIQYFFG